MGSVTTSTAPDELISLQEATDILSVSKSTLYRMLERKEVKGRKVGRQWRFSRKELQTYLDRGPHAVVLSTVGTEEVDALLPSLTEASQRLGLALPALAPNATAEDKVAAYVTHLIHLALNSSASDLHLAPERHSAAVWLRIDGVMHELSRLPSVAYPAVIGQVKQMAAMNIEERSLPQDGRIHLTWEERDFDVRANVLPTVYGEASVMRFLEQGSVLIGLGRLGFTTEDQTQLTELLQAPSGLLLTAGPSGSGKTTTVYSCLNEIHRPEKNTLTVEDPVEYQLPGIRQTMVNRRAGLTFPVALRAFLRQDPDVIMVGETRDLETAEIIVQAALTGHLVLSTMHANDAAATVLRLVEMGVEPFIVVNALLGVVYQRLLRKSCPHCAMPVTLPAEEMAHLRGLCAQGGYILPTKVQFSRSAGCDRCYQRGFRGRLGIFSLLEMTPAVREAVLRRVSCEELTRVAVAEGMKTLFADGIRKAADGLTCVEEVYRVTMIK